MFPWNFARSAETLFSRWAIKRVCKFLLKKKLGKFILGDIDLNQLDVQLSAGTIQLSDLALNVDYLNQKVRACAFFFLSVFANSRGYEFEFDSRSSTILMIFVYFDLYL